MGRYLNKYRIRQKKDYHKIKNLEEELIILEIKNNELKKDISFCIPQKIKSKNKSDFRIDTWSNELQIELNKLNTQHKEQIKWERLKIDRANKNYYVKENELNRQHNYHVKQCEKLQNRINEYQIKVLNANSSKEIIEKFIMKNEMIEHLKKEIDSM